MGPPLPPPPPQAPPLPFSYIGQLADGKDLKIFLMVASTQEQIVVKLGDTVLGSYRLIAAAPSGLTFTYLPLNQQQTLPLGSET